MPGGGGGADAPGADPQQAHELQATGAAPSDHLERRRHTPREGACKTHRLLDLVRPAGRLTSFTASPSYEALGAIGAFT